MPSFKEQIKIITRSKIFYKILSVLIYFYINIVFFTSKKYHIYSENFNKTSYEEKNAIYAFWHNRLSFIFFMKPRNIPINVVISEHKDGRIISETSSLFGVKNIPGSSNKISIKSLKTIINCLQNGESLAITPDGPRGPMHQINSSIVRIAQKTSKKIIPLSFSCKKKKVLRSWDKFILPLPFNIIYFVYGNPIDPHQNNVDILLKKELDRLHKQFDKKCH